MDEVIRFETDGSRSPEQQFNDWRKKEDDKIEVRGVTPLLDGGNIKLVVWYFRKKIHSGGFTAN